MGSSFGNKVSFGMYHDPKMMEHKFGRRKMSKGRFGTVPPATTKPTTLKSTTADTVFMQNANTEVKTAGVHKFGGVNFAGQRRRRSAEFGKRRRSSKKTPASRKKAMTAFRKFYKRYCKSGPVRRSRFGFGEGGNPPLWHSMGYEFCPDGQGGVLQTTGLFASPCTSAPAPAPASAPAPAVTGNLPALPAFGGRRRHHRRRY
jgi:hypothetical protein